MSIIHLTDTAARISSIVEDRGITTVSLEWGGPNDRVVTDFDLAQLGEVTACGGNNSTGWVVLAGPCILQIGDTIPLVLVADWVVTSARYIPADNTTVVTAALEDAAGLRHADRVTTIHHADGATAEDRTSEVDALIDRLNSAL